MAALIAGALGLVVVAALFVGKSVVSHQIAMWVAHRAATRRRAQREARAEREEKP